MTKATKNKWIANWWRLRKIDKEYYKKINRNNGVLIYTGERGAGKGVFSTHYLANEIEKNKKIRVLYSNIRLDWQKYFTEKYEPIFFYRFRHKWKKKRDKLVKMAERKTIYFDDFQDFLDIIWDPKQCRNAMFYVDECHDYMSSDESNIRHENYDIIKAFFKNIRKLGVLWIGTSQVFNSIYLGIRDQTSTIGVCTTWFGKITRVRYYAGNNYHIDENRNVDGKHIDTRFIVHYPAIRMLYDTRATVKARKHNVLRKLKARR